MTRPTQDCSSRDCRASLNRQIAFPLQTTTTHPVFMSIRLTGPACNRMNAMRLRSDTCLGLSCNMQLTAKDRQASSLLTVFFKEALDVAFRHLCKERQGASIQQSKKGLWRQPNMHPFLRVQLRCSEARLLAIFIVATVYWPDFCHGCSTRFADGHGCWGKESHKSRSLLKLKPTDSQLLRRP